VSSVDGLISSLESIDTSKADVTIAVPSLYLERVRSNISKNISIAAQNVSAYDIGAYTGELAASQLTDAGVDVALIGHSERRALFGETDADVSRKTAMAVASNMLVVGCLGETLEEREAGTTLDVVFRQVAAYAETADWESTVLAYEPVWAIGTGLTATPAQAQDVHRALREWLATNVSKEVAERTRIIYGGSVGADTAEALAREEDVDGFLVGGASLKPNDFSVIVRAAAAS